MSENITIMIGENIKQLREGKKMSQKDLAERMDMARPAISKWENGKSEPSSSQLVRLAKIFGVSTDTVVGNSSDTKKIIVIDTSALIKRPSILEELIERFDEVIIPEIVISELNNLKDRGKKPSLRKQASLVMSSIKTIRDDDTTKDDVIIEPSIDNEGKNDEKIVAIAKQRAKRNHLDSVFMFSNDKWFSFLADGINNLRTISTVQYEEMFVGNDDDFDVTKTIEFCSLVKSKKLDEVKDFDLMQVNINKANAEDGLTPLIQAVRNKDFKMVKFLLTLSKINIDALDTQKYHFTALHHATQLKNIDLMKLLIDSGADVDIGSDGRNVGNTCLMVASWSGFIKGVDILIAEKACTNQQDWNGFTPLIKACINTHFEVAKRLIEITDISIRSKDNKTAIDFVKKQKPNSNKIIALFKEKEHKNDR